MNTYVLYDQEGEPNNDILGVTQAPDVDTASWKFVNAGLCSTFDLGDGDGTMTVVMRDITIVP